MTKEAYQDIADNPIYPQLARAGLFDLHNGLMTTLDEFFTRKNGSKTLVVVGPGSEVVPFSEEVGRVASWLSDGGISLLDYNASISDAVPIYLKRKGFGDYFTFETQHDTIDLRCSPGKIRTIHRNVRENLPYVDNSVSAIDMTVAVHHATQYVQDIVAIFKECYRVLEEGGILHIGEGNVDMKHSERKIRKIADDILNTGLEAVVFDDNRDAANGYKRRLLFKKGQHYNYMPVLHDQIHAPAHVEITPQGTVIAQGVKQDCFIDNGYKQVTSINNTVVLPLIDHAIEDDFQGQIVPVREYYKSIFELTKPRLSSDLFEKFVAAITKEQSDAERGLVEFYTKPDVVADCMRQAGFTVESMKHTQHGPFVNTVGKK